ncbi:hypothetical protein GOBAR_DD05548 [Gossypium barbadense]|nr:hypothetical protein GOBAR_DD05548 [Gossypium barbadense]
MKRWVISGSCTTKFKSYAHLTCNNTYIGPITLDDAIAVGSDSFIDRSDGFEVEPMSFDINMVVMVVRALLCASSTSDPSKESVRATKIEGKINKPWRIKQGATGAFYFIIF